MSKPHTIYGIRRRFVFLQIKEHELWYLPEQLKCPYKYALIRVKMGLDIFTMWNITSMVLILFI